MSVKSSFSAVVTPRVDGLFVMERYLNIGMYYRLFEVLGNKFGGDGHSDFRLPDLRGRIPINHGTGWSLSGFLLGAKGGAKRFGD